MFDTIHRRTLAIATAALVSALSVGGVALANGGTSTPAAPAAATGVVDTPEPGDTPDRPGAADTDRETDDDHGTKDDASEKGEKNEKGEKGETAGGPDLPEPGDTPDAPAAR